MDNNKLDTITNLFEGKEIRSIWNSEKEEYFFSVVDVISALTDSNISSFSAILTGLEQNTLIVGYTSPKSAFPWKKGSPSPSVL